MKNNNKPTPSDNGINRIIADLKADRHRWGECISICWSGESQIERVMCRLDQVPSTRELWDGNVDSILESVQKAVSGALSAKQSFIGLVIFEWRFSDADAEAFLAIHVDHACNLEDGERESIFAWMFAGFETIAQIAPPYRSGWIKSGADIDIPVLEGINITCSVAKPSVVSGDHLILTIVSTEPQNSEINREMIKSIFCDLRTS